MLKAHPIAASSAIGEMPLFLTPDDAAELLRTSRKAIYALIDRQQLPGVTRLGRRILIRRDELLGSLRPQPCTPSSGGRR